MNSRTVFKKAIDFVFRAEGGLSDNKHDQGGLTKYGISQKAYPTLDIKNLDREQAASIYYTEYWSKLSCHAFPNPLATVLFDTAVNCGVASTSRWLQSFCNKKGSQLLVDGVIGPKTVLEVLSHDNHLLTAGIIASRLDRYSKIVARKPEQKVFMRGWIDRVSKLLFYVL